MSERLSSVTPAVVSVSNPTPERLNKGRLPEIIRTLIRVWIILYVRANEHFLLNVLPSRRNISSEVAVKMTFKTPAYSVYSSTKTVRTTIVVEDS